MTELVKATELSVLEYVQSLGLNPENVYYQRISSTNISVNSAQWAFNSPNKRAFLLANAQIEWFPTINKRNAANGADVAFDSRDSISFKPCMPFTNAMSSMSLTLNGAQLTLNQPRRFADHLCMMYAGKKGAEKCF
ncbi:MAG: hypothetical protein ACXAC7_24070, partial [Candidatus Hodarchaeales archaeon]